jgi:DNA-directed RNA polymerase specialized sigma24 family protein
VSTDAYLTALVRNLHISWIRRTATHQARHVAIEDYESADLALALAGPADQKEMIRPCRCLR